MPRKKKATRRANGTGSKITVMPSGLHRMNVSLGYREDGKRDLRTVYGKDDKDVQAKARDLQLRFGRGLVGQASDLTLGEWFNVWLIQREGFLEASSQEQYKKLLKNRIPERLKDIKLHAVRVRDFNQLDLEMTRVNPKTKKVLSFAVRSKVASVVRTALREAVRQEIIPVNPAESWRPKATKADLEKRTNAVSKALTDAEMDTFLIAAEGHELYPLFYILFALGLRVGEALGLEWADLNFKDRTVTVTQQAKIVENKVTLGSLKTRGSRRTLPLSPDLIAVLESHRWAQDKHRHTLGESWEEHGLVFASAVGTPRDRNNVNKVIHKIRKKVGVRPFTVHACRHTTLTALLRSGESPEVVAKYAGHSNSTTTRTTYRTVFQEELPTVSLSDRRRTINAPSKTGGKA
jgi:integrase